MTTTDATPAQLAMARRIAAHALCRPEKWKPGVKAGIYEEIMRGDADAEALVQGPLAAIIETTEAAAKLADEAAAGNRRREAQYRESSANDPSSAGQQVDMETAVAFAKMASGSSALAASLRNNVHLKAQS